MLKLNFLNSVFCLFLLLIIAGCSSSISGSVQETAESITAPAIPQNGGIYSPATPQKVMTRTLSGNISKYTVYLSVGSSQVAAP